MGAYVNPFTGQIINTSDPESPYYGYPVPLGGPTPVIPEGTGVVAAGPSDEYGFMTTYVAPGGATPDLAGQQDLVGFQATRGNRFYFSGDEWTIIQQYEDIASLQAQLEAAGALTGDYLNGSPDEATAKAMAKVLAAANASGLSWQQVLTSGVSAALAKKKAGAGGGGAAALTDEDIKAIGNKVAQGVLGRNLNDEEIGNFVPAFRGATSNGTSAATASENVVRQNSPAEAYAHDAGNVMQTISKALGG